MAEEGSTVSAVTWFSLSQYPFVMPWTLKMSFTLSLLFLMDLIKFDSTGIDRSGVLKASDTDDTMLLYLLIVLLGRWR